MESTIINSYRLSSTRNWGYAANSQEALWIDKQLSTLKYPVVTLGEYVESLSGGLTPRGANYPESGVIFIRVGNIQTYGLDLSDTVFIPESLHNGELQRCQVQADDVLLAITGATFGKACVVPPGIGEANINQHIVRIRTVPELLPEYLSFYLNSKVGRKQSLALATGGTRPALDYEAIRAMRIPLPSPEIQNKITESIRQLYKTRSIKLKQADEAIGNINNHVLNLLGIDLSITKRENRFTATSTEMSGKWRVENHDVRMLKEALNSCSYKIVQVKDIGTPIIEKAKLKDKFRYIEIGNIDTTTGSIRSEQLTLYDAANAPNNAQRRVASGDILISTRRPTRGAIAVVPDELDGEICTLFFSIIRIKPNIEVLPEYVTAFLRTLAGHLQIQQAITETTYPVISDSDVEQLMLPLPPKELQKQIVSEINQRIVQAKTLKRDVEDSVAKSKKEIERIIWEGEDVS